MLSHRTRAVRLGFELGDGFTAATLTDQEATTAALIAQHANVYRRGNACYEELNDDEKVVYEQLVFVETANVWSSFSQYQSGLLDQTTITSLHAIWKHYMTKPGFRTVWSENRNEYPEEFVQYFDKLSAASKGAPQLPD